MASLNDWKGPLSVVLATYRRGPSLRRLLEQLAAQTLPAAQFEVVVVDDGSPEPAAAALEGLAVPYRLTLLRQENAGPAAARDRGAHQAGGEVLLIVDDDMQVAPDFLERHLALHTPGTRTAVFGWIRPDPAVGRLPLFERYNAATLSGWADELEHGLIELQGNRLCTGNVSMRRADYLAVGGFDQTLECSEDAELGLRLEESGVRFVFSRAASVLHGSDHDDGRWVRRARRYGAVDSRIAKKHPGVAHADPWRYLYALPLAGRPFLWLGLLMPTLAGAVIALARAAAAACSALGLERLALRGAGVVFGINYFRGMRDEAGSTGALLRGLVGYLAKVADDPRRPPRVPRRRAFLAQALVDFGKDRRTRDVYEDKYGYQGLKDAPLLKELVEKIGLQILACYRWMRFLRKAGFGLSAKIVSRMTRHLYGSDIHWDAEIEGGVMIIHGMGMAISNAARIGPGCILSQNITLARCLDGVSRIEGAPTLEANVHVGPNVSLLGPIVVGAGSKIMAGASLSESVPPGSVVEPAPVRIRSRQRPRAEEKEEEAPAAGEPVRIGAARSG